ncbi:hypothetical protein [Sphingobacterium arenae]|uniref:Fur family transcriptional regulator n=1 Tax=Sphingobacterium arenae TaxID=1280598 RepID=A0ABR7Y586_9SPHI|nr:hypothetical protein [Sphingobacterium arenae]MBD1426460.1 hypothetical protein [Sphingobacterium arenae]
MMKVHEQTRLHGWIAQLRERGHIASKQRIVIMEALFQQREIADMEDFWIGLRQKHPVSWATFYNFIRLALKENWIGKDIHTSRCARYQILID